MSKNVIMVKWVGSCVSIVPCGHCHFLVCKTNKGHKLNIHAPSNLIGSGG